MIMSFSSSYISYFNSSPKCGVGRCSNSFSVISSSGTGTGSSASSGGGGSNSNPSHHSSHHSHPSSSSHNQHYQQYNNNGNNSSGSSILPPPPYQPQLSRMKHSASISSSSEFTSVSQQVPNVCGAVATKKMPQSVHSKSPSRSGSDKEPDRGSCNPPFESRKISVESLASAARKGPKEGHLGVAPHLVQSRESFQIALDNPVPLYF